MREPGPGSAPTQPELRRAVLAVSVLGDVDLEPTADGVVLPGLPPVTVPWWEVRHALGDQHPEGDDGRRLLTRWLRARRWGADLGPDELRERVRPVGLPVGHVLHPGRDWVRERVLGHVLDLGLGAVGLDPGRPDEVVLVPPPLPDAAGLDVDALWAAARRYLEAMGALAAERVLRDPKGVLRPVGDCDVLTLLAARSLRCALAGRSGGMATAVAPMRRRGWTQLRLVDPAFGPAAAAATDPVERGFARPLLVTDDELAMVPAGGRPQPMVLADPARDAPWARDVLYR